jgi:hypothetical protein
MIIQKNKQTVVRVMEQSSVYSVLSLGPSKISAQITNIFFKSLTKIEKYFNLCRNGKGTTVLCLDSL